MKLLLNILLILFLLVIALFDYIACVVGSRSDNDNEDN